MEFAIYLFISALCAAAMFFSAVNSARKPGQPERGLFRLDKVDAADVASGKSPQGGRRNGPWRPAS